jgi:hypothetical protein
MYANRRVAEWMNERRYVYNQVTEIINTIRNNHRAF